jgi:regulatory protein
MVQKITALKVQKRNNQRVNLYLDDTFAFGLSRLTAAWLEVGQELDDEKILELQAAAENEAAYQRALHFLSFRPRTIKEVERNLRKHNISDAVIPEIIERLSRNSLVNDKSFAQDWVENRSEFRPRGRRALRMELRQKGIENDVIDEVLNEIDEEDLAYRAAYKADRKYRRFEWDEYRKKMIAFLARRGFNYSTAAPIIEKVWLELHDDVEMDN